MPKFRLTMKQLVFWGILAVALGSVPLAARAQTITDDPLHGFCSGCADNGTNTPITSFSSTFGFSISPGPQSGTDYLIDFLIPDNVTGAGAMTLTVTASGGGITNGTTTATLISSTPWTSGDLQAYNGVGSAKPSNPIGAFLPSTQTTGGQVSATGFFVYQADLGAATILTTPGTTPTQLGQQPGGNGPVLTASSGSSIPEGSYAVAFLENASKTGGNVATAPSGALFLTQTTPPTHKVPEPGALALLLPGLVGLAVLRRRKSRSRDAR